MSAGCGKDNGHGRWFDNEGGEEEGTFTLDESGLVACSQELLTDTSIFGPKAGKGGVRFYGTAASQEKQKQNMKPGYGFDVYAGIHIHEKKQPNEYLDQLADQRSKDGDSGAPQLAPAFPPKPADNIPGGLDPIISKRAVYKHLFCRRNWMSNRGSVPHQYPPIQKPNPPFESTT